MYFNNIIRLIIFSLIITSISSCDFKEKINTQLNEYKKIDTDLENYFNHENININIGWGTKEEKNYGRITFFQYDIENNKYSTLKKVSSKVKERLLIKYSKHFKNKHYIEVRFTEGAEENENNDFISFKYDDF